MKFYLVDNPLTEDETDFRAVPVTGKKRTIEDVVRQIVHRSVGLTESQVGSVLKEADTAIQMYLSEGDTVETELCTLQPRVRGVFHSATEAFDRNKHEAYINVRPSRGLKQLAGQLPVERVSAVKNLPLIEVLRDLDSDTNNDVLTPDGDVRIHGNALKFDPADAQQGVFLIDSKGKEVRVTRFTDVLPRQLTFRVPKPLAKGDYRLEVRSALSGKGLRVGQLEDTLTVK